MKISEDAISHGILRVCVEIDFISAARCNLFSSDDLGVIVQVSQINSLSGNRTTNRVDWICLSDIQITINTGIARNIEFLSWKLADTDRTVGFDDHLQTTLVVLESQRN